MVGRAVLALCSRCDCMGLVDVAGLLLELYGRIPPLVRTAVDGLDADRLTTSPAPGANTIGWLTWHLARVQDHHVADAFGTEQIWVEGPWAERFGLAPDPANTGYGHSDDEMLAVRPDGCEAVVDYFMVVDDRTRSLLAGLEPGQLERIVDRRWDPPVTLGVRLISVADDCLQHVGQAAYVRGVIEG